MVCKNYEIQEAASTVNGGKLFQKRYILFLQIGNNLNFHIAKSWPHWELTETFFLMYVNITNYFLSELKSTRMEIKHKRPFFSAVPTSGV